VLLEEAAEGISRRDRPHRLRIDRGQKCGPFQAVTTRNEAGSPGRFSVGIG
jgi:hypothetical protein